MAATKKILIDSFKVAGASAFLGAVIMLLVSTNVLVYTPLDVGHDYFTFLLSGNKSPVFLNGTDKLDFSFSEELKDWRTYVNLSGNWVLLNTLSNITIPQYSLTKPNGGGLLFKVQVNKSLITSDVVVNLEDKSVTLPGYSLYDLFELKNAHYSFTEMDAELYIKNPLQKSLVISGKELRQWAIQERGNACDISLSQELSVSTKISRPITQCNTITTKGKNGSLIVNEDCTISTEDRENIVVQKVIVKDDDIFNLSSMNKILFFVHGTRNPAGGYQNCDWKVGMTLDGSEYVAPYDNWTANWTSCMNITFEEKRNIARANNTIFYNLTGLTNKNANGSDIRIVNAGCFRNGAEIPYVLLTNTSTSAEVFFYADSAALTNTTYSVVWNYTSAPDPKYTNETTNYTMSLFPGSSNDGGPVVGNIFNSRQWYWEVNVGTYNMVALWGVNGTDGGLYHSQYNNEYPNIYFGADGSAGCDYRRTPLFGYINCTSNSLPQQINTTFFSRTPYFLYEPGNFSSPSFYLWIKQGGGADLKSDPNNNWYLQNYSTPANAALWIGTNKSGAAWSGPNGDNDGWKLTTSSAGVPFKAYVGWSLSSAGYDTINNTILTTLHPLNNTIILGALENPPSLNTAPVFQNITIELNGTTNISYKNINTYWGSNITRIQVNCSDVDAGEPLRVDGNLTDRVGLRMTFRKFFNQTATPQFANATLSQANEVLTINRSQNWTLSLLCGDAAINTTNTTIFNVANGSLSIAIIAPSTNVTVAQNQTFQASFNITCAGGECYTVTAYVDPPVEETQESVIRDNWFVRLWKKILSLFEYET